MTPGFVFMMFSSLLRVSSETTPAFVSIGPSVGPRSKAPTPVVFPRVLGGRTLVAWAPYVKQDGRGTVFPVPRLDLTPEDLREAALAYLARRRATTAMITRVLERRIAAWLERVRRAAPTGPSGD